MKHENIIGLSNKCVVVVNNECSFKIVASGDLKGTVRNDADAGTVMMMKIKTSSQREVLAA